MKKNEKFMTFFNPGGFIEQHFIGNQTPDSVIDAISELVQSAKKIRSKNQDALILVDVTKVPKIDVSGRMIRARQEAVKAMMNADYDRVAVYGSTALQVLVNTLILIAGKRDKIRVFSDRLDALKWLKGGI